MGREPKQGMEGRSRDSHGQRANTGDGRQEQGQPWAESQRRERKASRNRAIGASAYARNGQQQGNWGKCLRTERTTARQQGQVLTHRTDSKAALGQSAVAKRGGRQTGQHFRAECRSSKGAEGKQGSILGQSAVAKRGGRQTGQHLRAECRSKKGRKANRAAFRAECRSRKGAAGLIKKKAF